MTSSFPSPPPPSLLAQAVEFLLNNDELASALVACLKRLRDLPRLVERMRDVEGCAPPAASRKEWQQLLESLAALQELHLARRQRPPHACAGRRLLLVQTASSSSISPLPSPVCCWGRISQQRAGYSSQVMRRAPKLLTVLLLRMPLHNSSSSGRRRSVLFRPRRSS